MATVSERLKDQIENARTQFVGFEKQVALPVEYKGIRLECGYRMDLVVEDVIGGDEIVDEGGKAHMMRVGCIGAVMIVSPL